MSYIDFFLVSVKKKAFSFIIKTREKSCFIHDFDKGFY